MILGILLNKYGGQQMYKYKYIGTATPYRFRAGSANDKKVYEVNPQGIIEVPVELESKLFQLVKE